MKTVPLGDVASFIRGVTFKPSDVLEGPTADSVGIMRTKNVQAELDVVDVLQIPSHLVRRRDQYLRTGDLLISSANSWNLVGRCCWVPDLRAPAAIGGFVTALRVTSDQLDPRFLYRWFSSPRTQTDVRNSANQTTNIANLNLKRCEALRFPIPSLDEQCRIADILDSSDILRRHGNQVVAATRLLEQAVFIEMFGDPVSNPHDYPVERLGMVGTLDRGVSKHRPRNDPALLGGAYPLIQTGDVARSGGTISTYTSTYSELGLAQSRLWPAGTLCITIAANIAQTGLLAFDACFPDSVVGFTADEPTTVYVRTWLTFLQATLEASAPQSAQRNINLAILRNLPLPIPPAAKRKEFHERLQSVKVFGDAVVRREQRLNELFTSLQSRAFSGQL